jgi:hypothetical protein
MTFGAAGIPACRRVAPKRGEGGRAGFPSPADENSALPEPMLTSPPASQSWSKPVKPKNHGAADSRITHHGLQPFCF